MQKRGMAWWAGGRQRLQEKRGKTPNFHRNSIEAPPKLHRNITPSTP